MSRWAKARPCSFGFILMQPYTLGLLVKLLVCLFLKQALLHVFILLDPPGGRQRRDRGEWEQGRSRGASSWAGGNRRGAGPCAGLRHAAGRTLREEPGRRPQPSLSHRPDPAERGEAAGSGMAGRARGLYRRLLRLHRALPPALRALGDRYVRDEFRRHRAVGPAEAQRFLREWEASARRRRRPGGGRRSEPSPRGGRPGEAASSATFDTAPLPGVAGAPAAPCMCSVGKRAPSVVRHVPSRYPAVHGSVTSGPATRARCHTSHR